MFDGWFLVRCHSNFHDYLKSWMSVLVPFLYAFLDPMRCHKKGGSFRAEACIGWDSWSCAGRCGCEVCSLPRFSDFLGFSRRCFFAARGDLISGFGLQAMLAMCAWRTPYTHKSTIYMHVGCNYIMSVWEMQTHVHQVWVLKWLNWIACWFVVKAISWQWWHTGPLVAFWVLLVRCFTNSIFVYEPAHVGPARMNHVSFALEFKSTVQHFINVSDLHDGWSLPLNYI